MALQNTQETIGAAVLPSITKLLNKGTDWLNNTKNQKLIQDDLNAAMTTGATAATVLADSFGLITAAARPATGALGSLKKALNDLGGGPGSEPVYRISRRQPQPGCASQFLGYRRRWWRGSCERSAWSRWCYWRVWTSGSHRTTRCRARAGRRAISRDDTR